MTDLSNVIRWNANFVRGLAESVLNRARVIRSSLSPAQTAVAAAPEAKVKVKRTLSAKKKAAIKRAKAPKRRSKA